MELIDLVNSNDLTQMVNFATQIQDSDLTVLLFWVCFFLLMLVFILQWLSVHWEILIMLLSQFPLTFHQIHNGMPCFIAYFMIILVLIGTVFVIIWETLCDHLRDLHGRISLNSLLLLLVNFVKGIGWNWCMYPSSWISGQASLMSMVFSCLCICHSS